MASSPPPKHPRVLLPFTGHTLRIPGSLAEEICFREALVVGPTGTAKTWRVEVGWDGDRAFLGRGWSEFVTACGVNWGWFFVLRHRGRGVLTVKAFDADWCLWGLRALPSAAAAEAVGSSQDTGYRPQFLRILREDFMAKMLIPAKFVQRYIPREYLNYPIAIVSGPLGTVFSIKLEINQAGVLFKDGWSQFLFLNDITEVNTLLLRYEGNLAFTVKVFEADGCQRESKDITMQQLSTLPDIQECRQESSVSIQKGCNSYFPSRSGLKKQIGPMTRSKKVISRKRAIFGINPKPWLKKEINVNSLKKEVALPTAFCHAVKLPGLCMITLKTLMSNNKSWKVHAVPRKTGSYRIGTGWRRFCRENNLKLGDVCTFKVIDTTMWHVVVTRRNETEYPSTSSRMRMSENKRSRSKRNKRPKGSRSSFNKAAFHKISFYEIGTQSWIKKAMNAHTLKQHLALTADFCNAIGLWESCMITLKTSMESTISWEVRGISIKNGRNYLLVEGWRNFCQQNGLKEGDICTFNVVETTLWHVVIKRYKEKIDQLCYENPFASSLKRKRGDNRSSSGEQKRPKGSMISWYKASPKTGCFDIRPPAWITKEINTWSIKKALYLPPVFCRAIGIQEPCTITLKTSMSSTTSWSARVFRCNNSRHHVKGLKRFYQDNGIKVGDLCTFKIIETTLWHVTIEPLQPRAS